MTNPLEPLMMSLVRGYVDDEDLTAKLRALYQVQRAPAHRPALLYAAQDGRMRAGGWQPPSLAGGAG